MAAGVFPHCFDAEQIAAGFLLDELGDVLIISQNLAIHYDAACSGYRVHTVRFRHRKIGYQHIPIGCCARNFRIIRRRRFCGDRGSAFCRRRLRRTGVFTLWRSRRAGSSVSGLSTGCQRYCHKEGHCRADPSFHLVSLLINIRRGSHKFHLCSIHGGRT